MIRWLYNLLFPLAFLLLLPGYLRRMFRRGNYRRGFGQRFGWYSAEVRARLAAGPPPVWLQAVSVGETLVALKLVDALRARRPDLPLVLSTTTTTSHALARARVGPGVAVLYTPVDFPWAVRRAFERLRPALVVIVDGGLWPNLLWESRRRRVPVALVNARLSPRSETRFRRFRALASGMFGLLDLVCVTDAADPARWQSLGVPPERIRLTGSIKFDDAGASGIPSPAAVAPEPRAFLTRLGVDPAALILLAGSTHPGEEHIVAEAFLPLRGQFPDLFLILVPRHVERAAEVMAELTSLGLRATRRTLAGDATAPPPDALLVDTTGELASWYTVATVVFIGKSLASQGGQNPAEAIAAGKPVVFGPRMENFQELAARLLQAGGAVQVPNAAALPAACARLLADPAERTRQAAAARQVVAIHHGAAGRTAELLLDPANFPLASGAVFGV